MDLRFNFVVKYTLIKILWMCKIYPNPNKNPVHDSTVLKVAPSKLNLIFVAKSKCTHSHFVSIFAHNIKQHFWLELVSSFIGNYKIK